MSIKATIFFNVPTPGFQVNNGLIIFITLHEVTLHRNYTLKWFYVELDYNYISNVTKQLCTRPSKTISLFIRKTLPTTRKAYLPYL